MPGRSSITGSAWLGSYLRTPCPPRARSVLKYMERIATLNLRGVSVGSRGIHGVKSERGSSFSACCLRLGVLERDPYSKLHLPRSAVRVRAGTGQNPVLARSADSGRAAAESRRTGVIQRSAGRAVQHAA